MGISSRRYQQYYVQCDICGCEDVVADSTTEHVHSKRAAIAWAKMHKINDGRIVCNDCYKAKLHIVE